MACAAAGAGIGTLASRIAAAIIIIVMLNHKSNAVRVEGVFHLEFRGDMIKRILFVGIPNGLENGMFQAGKLVVLVIDVHGAANIRRMYPGATTVFLLPPSEEELERRLRGRGTETEESIRERLATAKQELAQQDRFAVKLVNNEIGPCAEALYQVICQRAGLNA